jgi:hypothetical protein
MIVVKIEYYGDESNKEVVDNLIKVLNKAINNLCVEYKQEFIIQNNVTVIGIPIKMIP